MADEAETLDAAHGATDAAHGAADAAHASSPGMPQLDFATFPNQIFWLVLTLLAIYFVLTKIALPRISSVIAERQGTLTNDLAAAEDLKRQAAEAEESYNTALANARAEASRIAQETRDEIQAQTQVEIDKADAQIAARTAEGEARIAEIEAGAIATAEEVARDVATEIVRAFGPGQDVDAAAVADAVANRVRG
ncbi:F0F1 ATP synthase subunit B' [Jannaschia sp. CCS1]|uniref:ATP synthase subunit b 2 n=1 Tax=Jannaschia sp. (strain CCS1) TaxID=290400 RepID=ATPF2_JANSC|nr:F0F1 ATP synthase subunit B' [Jannaschia sp. CCS1]Q28UC6.1 RecName: Full=ATP synthase subunit b 2; AltName: Full=ATP synthase F(0) sector subunit b 2; AltName: Full=ATPase subunit I 2; AltName: Full=F-type ATPase subunit b 2; Short=F-ATPase subunit b 2 [Jannaschia sp. CCS1]ABD53686.1 H+-transporting two-sector ATPase B/B' subunit [Jannaschia sp. CCS1]